MGDLATLSATASGHGEKLLAVGSTARSDPTYVEWQLVERLCKHLAKPEDQLVLALARLAGLRDPSETSTLLWSDVDFANMRLRVWDEKRSRRREPQLDERLLPYLAAVESIHGDKSICALPGAVVPTSYA